MKLQITNYKLQKRAKFKIQNIWSLSHWNLFGIWNLEFGTSEKGFTLIELLVVSAITVILSIGAAVSFKTLRTTQEINGARFDTISKLREIQTFILNGKIVPGQGQAADAYQITLTVGSGTYRIDSDINGTIALLENAPYSAFAGRVTLGSLTVNGVPVTSAVIRITAPYGAILVNGLPYQIVSAELLQATGLSKNMIIDGVSGKISIQTGILPPPPPPPPPPPNQPPIVNAGIDQTITLPATASLIGSASDDSLPSGSILTTTWSKFSGPDTVNFGNASALSTTASFSASGTYVLRLSASDSQLTSTDDIIVNVNPASPSCATIGSNSFFGCYYSGMNFNTLLLTRTDSTINFDWGGGSPDPTVPVDLFSARWEGDFSFSTTGTYTFTTTADDGVRVYVDNTLQIDKWIDQPPTTYTKNISLTSGTHRVKVEYYENGGGAVSHVSWVLAPVNILGNNTIAPSTDTDDSNYLNAFSFTMPNQAGSAVSMSVYIPSPVGPSPGDQFQMALYSDSGGNPGALIASTAIGTLTANTWNTIPITATLNPNTTYWLVYNTNGNSPAKNDLKIGPGASGQFRWKFQTFGTMPPTYGTQNGQSNSTASIYISY